MAIPLLGAAATAARVGAFIRSQGFKKAAEKYGEEIVKEVAESITQPGAPIASAGSAGNRGKEPESRLSPEDIGRMRKKVKQQRLNDNWRERKNETDDAVARMIAERQGTKVPTGGDFLSSIGNRPTTAAGYKSGGTVARNRRNHKGCGCVMSDRRKKTLYT